MLQEAEAPAAVRPDETVQETFPGQSPPDRITLNVRETSPWKYAGEGLRRQNYRLFG